jgi:2'-hydroxyisoflavone reductase
VRILVIGGTRFSGRHLADAALAAGHEVTVLHRGTSAPDGVPGAASIVADRDLDLGGLADGTWDATVDMCAYLPRQVRALADALGGRGGHQLLISSISVYATPPEPGAVEDTAPLQAPADEAVTTVTAETYGPLKVACEQVAHARDARLTVTRPSYIVGPRDPTGRFSWWVDRIRRGGDVVCPGPADAPLQVIDARDLAAFHLRLLETGTTGTFHVADPFPARTFAETFDAIASLVAPAGTTLTWVDRDVLRDRGADESTWPLWHPDPADHGLMQVDPARACRAGLATRSLDDTVRDLAAWLDTPEGAATVVGVGPDDEDAWRA